ncbi:MAG: putative porin [Bacteroidales bacterium]|nr:putative porin [Bacteroidales bacterium]
MVFRRLLIFLFLTLIVLWTGKGYAQTSEEEHGRHEHTIDSAMAISPNFMPVFKAKLPGTFFNPMVYKPIDTSMFYTSEYDPMIRTENLYQSIGICAQAHQNMVFDYEHEIGFSMLRLPYPLYFKQQKDVDYYDVQTSYTNIAYDYGITKENNVWATHAQKIKQFEFKFDLHGYRNSGYFVRQATNMFNMDVVAHYETPKDIYGVTVSYVLNHGQFAENGGLSDYHLFADRQSIFTTLRNGDEVSVTNNLNSFGVMFGNATSLINTHDALLQQYVNIKDKKGHYFGTITHSFQFKKLKSNYFDCNLNNDFYLDRYYLNTDTTNDTLNYYSLINTLQWSNYEPLQKQSDAKYFFRIAGGIRHEYVHAKMPFYVGNNFSLFARTNIRLFSVWDIYGSIAYSFNNYNRNDAIANAAATFAISRKMKHYIGLGADFYRVSADYLYSYYIGNNNMWYLSWPKENNLKLSAFWTIFDYKVSFNYFMMKNHLYLDSDFQPQSCERAINIVQLNLFAPVRVKNFYMDVNMSLQHSTDPIIAVPLFAGKLYAAYCFRIFRNRLRIQVGGDLMYNTLYHADGYNPILHQFYHQDRVKVGNYLYFDANITFQVDRIAFFVRAGNLLEGLISYKYFTTPYYPMQGRNFALGITWRFYD